jgi:hypothetical protein
VLRRLIKEIDNLKLKYFSVELLKNVMTLDGSASLLRFLSFCTANNFKNSAGFSSCDLSPVLKIYLVRFFILIFIEIGG